MADQTLMSIFALGGGTA